MKIGIIALGYAPGKTGGTETYFRNLIIGLQECANDDDSFTVIVRKE